MIFSLIICSRIDKLLNDNWEFVTQRDFYLKTKKRVDLPHTWNAQDGQIGKIDYYRGIGVYSKNYTIPKEYEGERLFMKFDGVMISTLLFINEKLIGQHVGGYSQFTFDITKHVKYGANNLITIKASNAETFDIVPLSGDFNVYGGIYRDVHLIVTNQTTISLLDNSSTGVYVTQNQVDENIAKLSITTIINSSQDLTSKTVILRTYLLDDGKVVMQVNSTIDAKQQNTTQQLDVQKPHLWSGRDDPFLYQLKSQILIDNQLVDEIIQNIGLRNYSIDANKGFMLNGKHVKLHGCSHHQERIGKGNSLHFYQQEEDVQFLLEAGFNSVRPSHYQQSQLIYDLYDKNGLVAWAEIPWIEVFYNLDSLKSNLKQQAIELVKQNFNHPSIIFYGLFNELNLKNENPIDFLKELNKLVKELDPNRITSCSSNAAGDINYVTDITANNKYFGWYGGEVSDLAKFLDQEHKDHNTSKLAISEYGAGASIYHQQEIVNKTTPTGRFHPENYQTHLIQETFKQLHQRDFVFASYVHTLFDYHSSWRAEGQLDGVNDKGLVTADRMVRKDIFYFYKANLNKQEDTLHITECRNNVRKNLNTTIQVFTNLNNVKVTLNNKQLGILNPDTYKTIKQAATLKVGENLIEIEATDRNNKQIVEKCNIFVE